MKVNILWSGKKQCHVSRGGEHNLCVELYPTFTDAYNKISIPEQAFTFV